MTRNERGYKKLSLSDSHYVYDSSTNALLKIEESVFKIIDDYFKYKPKELKNLYANQMTQDDRAYAIEFLDQAIQSAGMFLPFFWKNYSFLVESEYLNGLLSTDLRRLMLEISEQCNQRCRYCVFSGGHIGERPHRDRVMTWDTAKRSIDYFFARAGKKDLKSIKFYGGEPLLNFPVLEKSVQYVRAKREFEPCEIAMTSNITLLTNERVKFLVDNDVVLFVSLDGPAAVNDANRIYPDGRGTHARVIERLAYIRSQYPVYSRKRIYVHCTFDIPNDIWKIFHYFSEPLLRELSVEIHPLNRGDSEVTTVSNDEANQHFERLDRLVESYLDRLGSRTYFNYSLFHNVFKDVFGDLAARKLGIASTNEGPNGVCIPGRNMLFVGSNGSFYTCHKFSQEGNEIGNCEDGVDIKRVQNLLRGFVSFYNENCQECWAFRLCKHCFVHCLEGGRISESRRKRSCELEKERIVEALERFIYIWENEPDVAFENEFSLHSTVRSHQAKESKT